MPIRNGRTQPPFGNQVTPPPAMQYARGGGAHTR